MRDISVVDVKIEDNEVVISLLGGSDNVCGSLRLYERDTTKRNHLADDARSMIDRVLVDLAFTLNGRWRLIGKNRQIIGGLEPSKLDISQTFTKPVNPPLPPWGLNRPWMEEE